MMRSPRRAWWVAISGVVVATIAAGGFWIWSADTVATGPTPRLAVDRRDVDLGALPFGTPVRATFVLTNVGDGPLTITGTPRVRAVQGC